MMESQQRPQTALPRFTKLPQARTLVEPTALPRPSTPTRPQTAVSDKRASIAVARPGSSLSSGIRPPSGIPSGRPGTANSRAGFGLARRPQSQAINSYDYTNYDENANYGHMTYQENESNDPNSSAGSDASDVSPSASPTSRAVPKLNGLRKPRASLSDRTIESLSTMSPAPMNGQRRSSFFNPQSPMTSPQRPLSSAHPVGTRPHAASVSKLSYGGLKPPGFARPASPPKKAIAAPATGLRTPGKSGIASGALPRPGTMGTPGASRIAGASATGRPVSMIGGPTANRPRTALQGHQRAASSVPPRTVPAAATAKPGLKKPGPSQLGSAFQKTPRPVSTIGTPKASAEAARPPVSRPRPALAKPASKLAASPQQSEGEEDERANFARSSNALRDQIAKAKAAHRAALTKQRAETEPAPPADFDFESCADPFNQNKTDGKDSLRSRIDSARRDGRLNIAGMDFKDIPEEVMQMYDAAAMETSSVSWSECVDLVRFNAADNEIAQISEDVFPDVDKETLANDPDGRGMQFGGIEVLDLHGNLLSKIPRGLCRLERLTTLNLARNDLENNVFDIICNITTLRELNLSGNKLSDKLPDTVGNLTHLEVLNLSGNKLNLLPGSLRELTELRVLDVSQNRLSMIDLSTLAHLPLTELHASYNALTGALFPTNLTGMEHLQILEVSNNSLASLSFMSLHLPALKQLNVSANRLMMLPDVSEWKNLISLLAEENMLTQFPDGFASLRSTLKIANFERNNITRIDEVLAHMDALESISLAGNPIRERKYLTMNCVDIKRDLAKRLSNPSHEPATSSST